MVQRRAPKRLHLLGTVEGDVEGDGEGDVEGDMEGSHATTLCVHTHNMKQCPNQLSPDSNSPLIRFLA